MGWLEDLTSQGLIGSTQDEKAFYVRCLVMGQMGAGKTHFAATFPKPLILNFDQGEATVTSNKLDIPVINFPARAKVFKLLMDILRDARDKTGPFGKDGKYADRETIIIDSATALGQAILFEVCMFPDDPKNKIDLTKDKPEFDQWGFTSAKLQQIFNVIRDLHFNLVVTALPTIDAEGDAKIAVGYPDLPGGFRKQIGSYFDEVYFMVARKGKAGETEMVYETYSTPYKVWNNRSRWGIPSMVQNMDYKILKGIMEKIQKDGKPEMKVTE